MTTEQFGALILLCVIWVAIFWAAYDLGRRRGSAEAWRRVIGTLDELQKTLAAEAPERPK